MVSDAEHEPTVNKPEMAGAAATDSPTVFFDEMLSGVRRQVIPVVSRRHAARANGIDSSGETNSTHERYLLLITNVRLKKWRI